MAAPVGKAQGNACVLAIATAQPANVINHSEYPDYYFKVTNSEHMTGVKRKFQRICERAQINRRHVLLTEEMLKQHPSLTSYDDPSHNDRQQIMLREIPRLGKEAADKAVAEWGQPLSGITHLVFNCTSAIHMPGNDFELAETMGLSPHVERIMLYHVGCHAGGTVLRIAKTLAESRRGARVLVVCSEITACLFRGPRPDGGHIDNLVAQVLFGDGAAALIVGADPDVAAGESPCFELLSAQQTVLPDSRQGIEGDVTEAGLMVHLLKNVASVISKHLEDELKRAVKPLGIPDSDWNSLFWISHPGGAAILDAIEAKLALQPSKLRASRHVLAENGNMSSASVLFILEEIRRWSAANGCSTTGEGLPLGVLVGFGPGISVETIVLKAFPLPSASLAA